MKKLPIILLTKSDGTNTLINEMTIGDVHRIHQWRVMIYPGQSESERQIWVDLFLEQLFPDLTPFDREYAFILTYILATGVGKDRADAICPKCGQIGKLVWNLYQETDRELKTVIYQNDSPKWEIIYKSPTVPGGTDGGPYGIRQLGEEEYTPDEFEEYNVTPELGDYVQVNGVKTEYSVFIPMSEIEILYKKDSTIYNIQEIDEDTRAEIYQHIKTFGAAQFASFSKSPIKVPYVFKCNNPECLHSERKELNRVLEVLETIISGEQLAPMSNDYLTAMSLSEHNQATLSEVLNMNGAEFKMIVGILKSKLKEKKK